MRKNWKRRHFVLEGKGLRYHASEGDGVPKGFVVVRDARDVGGDQRRPHRIDIDCAGNRVLAVAAETAGEKAAWLAALRAGAAGASTVVAAATGRGDVV